MRASLEVIGADGNTDLSTLTYKVAGMLNQSPPEVQPPVIFRVLCSLFRAGAFQTEPGEQPSRPRIKGPAKDSALWDYLFVKNCLALMGREKPSWPFVEGAVRSVFGASSEAVTKIIGELSAE